MKIIAANCKSGNSVTLAVAALAAGECVALPTETVYGLAADATNGRAVAEIFAIKGRPRFNPLICHVDSLPTAERHGVFNAGAGALARRFWPGPLTLVVTARADSDVHELVRAGMDSLALRCPQGFARDVIARFGKPLAAPSANLSGRLSPTTALHVAQAFAKRDLLILDGGPCRVGLESTIVRVEDDRLVLLRPGAITPEQLTDASGMPVDAASGGKVEAPGMMASHYAPEAKVAPGVRRCPAGAALLAFGDGADKERSAAATMLNLSEQGDLLEAAANLFHHLKLLDEAGPPLIAVEPVPEQGIGLAINDRLRRAAAPRNER
jgi:L-threonylcarbamoyladenylate synthase